MRRYQWQWLRSSFARPNFSEPKSRATGADSQCCRIRRPARSKRYSGACRSRLPSDVVPTTSVHPARASASVACTWACSRIEWAFTALRASRNATSYGATRCRSANPIFSGLRGETRTTRSAPGLASACAGALAADRLLLEVRVTVQALFIELQQAPRFLVTDALLANRGFDIFAKLLEQRGRAELDIVEHFAHGGAVDH